MKRYVLFAGDAYYPIGGWEDFQSSHDTLEEAQIAAERWVESDSHSGYWWLHIADVQSGEILHERGDRSVQE